MGIEFGSLHEALEQEEGHSTYKGRNAHKSHFLNKISTIKPNIGWIGNTIRSSPYKLSSNIEGGKHIFQDNKTQNVNR